MKRTTNKAPKNAPQTVNHDAAVKAAEDAWESKTPRIVDVEIKKDGFLEQTITVRPIWSDVDRNDFAWGLRSSEDKVAQRLKAALMAGKVYSRIEVLTDVNGKTFVSALAAVRGRCLNADLRSIGF